MHVDSGERADRCCATPPLLREPLTELAAAEMATKLKALADPVRLRLFSAIASRRRACVCDISGGIDVSQPRCRITSRCCAPPA
ncbi:hypothetical protein MARA_62130 [Mycolicibacterium arabiense]|uniref:HTH arsR-type domain-containing protein n=1 Tax=Mycolicibacterium arabiense TaxID=1286181 RepID=A0A7I7S9S0_9MYCO|nr:hypothetical protein MARA_62130 [Mycolicibacterium arabiense]